MDILDSNTIDMLKRKYNIILDFVQWDKTNIPNLCNFHAQFLKYLMAWVNLNSLADSRQCEAWLKRHFQRVRFNFT